MREQLISEFDQFMVRDIFVVDHDRCASRSGASRVFCKFPFLAERYVTSDNWAFVHNGRQMTARVGYSAHRARDTNDAV